VTRLAGIVVHDGPVPSRYPGALDWRVTITVREDTEYRCDECGELAVTDAIARDIGGPGVAYCPDHPSAVVICGPGQPVQTIEGGITLWPDPVNGGVGPCGSPIDGWIDPGIVRWLRTLTDCSIEDVCGALQGGVGSATVRVERAEE
jgi:hypothetical protein